MANCLCGVQAFRTNTYTVHDTPAAEYAERVIQVRQSLGLGGITTIHQEAIGLQQARRTDELIRVPPEGRTRCGAAGTENTLVQAVQLLTVFRRLQALDSRRRGVVHKVRHNFFVLLVEQTHIHHQVTDNRQARQRAQNQLVVLDHFGNRSDTSQTVLAVHVHAIGATNALTTGTTECNSQILAFRQLDLDVLHVRGVVSFRVITVQTYQHFQDTPLVGPDFRLEGRNRFRCKVHITLANTLVEREVDGVLQPVFVVTLGKVVTGVRAATFFTLDRRLGGCVGNLVQVIQLQGFDAGSVEGLAGISQFGLANALADFFQHLQAFFHALTVTEYAEVKLHAVLQILTNLGYIFTFRSTVQTLQACHGALDVFFGSAVNFKAATQLLFNVQASRTTEHNQVKQGVTTQTVSAVYRHTSCFTAGKQARDWLVDAVFVLGQGLATHVGRNTAHHVVTGRNHRNRLFNRVNVSKGTGQLTDTRQTQVQGFFTQVIQLQKNVILVGTTAATFKNLQNHGTGHNVTAGQVFGVRSITLHEALAFGVDQVTTLTPATFSYQNTGTVDTGRVELPHFHVLNRVAGTQRHADTVTGVDQGVGGGRVNTSGTAGSQDRSLGLDVRHFTRLDVDGHNTNHFIFAVLDQIYRVPLVQEGSTTLQVGLVQSVQQSVTGTVSSGTGTGCLGGVVRTLGLTTERTLVNTALLSTGERKTHVLQLEYGLGAYGTHVFDGVLVTDIVGALDGVVHVPAPVVVGISTCDRTGDTALGRYGVRTGRKYFGDTRSLDTGLCQLQGGTHTGSAATDNNRVVRHGFDVSHRLKPPQNLNAPHDIYKHHQNAGSLKQEARHC